MTDAPSTPCIHCGGLWTDHFAWCCLLGAAGLGAWLALAKPKPARPVARLPRLSGTLLDMGARP